MSKTLSSYILFLYCFVSSCLFVLVVLGRNENPDPITPLASEEYITGLPESFYIQDTWSHTGHRLSSRFKKKKKTLQLIDMFPSFSRKVI